MKKFLAMLCISCLVLITAAGCFENVQIIGTWAASEDGTGFSYTFENGGTGSYNMGGLSYDFTYEMDQDKLTITTKLPLVGSTTTDYTVSFQSGNLVLKAGETETTWYKKK